MTEEIGGLAELAQMQGLEPHIVGALYVAHKVLGPSLDELGQSFRRVTKKQVENLVSIAKKVPEASEPWYPHERTVMRVLNDASLYDDDLMQTYIAGLIAGSRNSDGSDDRPVFYLTMIDGLTALQLRFFHALYQGVAQAHKDPQGLPHLYLRIDEVEANVKLMEGATAPAANSGMAALLGLETAGLIQNLAIFNVPEEASEISFFPTRMGMLLFDWAHGFGDEDLYAFPLRERPSIGVELEPYTAPLVSDRL